MSSKESLLAHIYEPLLRIFSTIKDVWMDMGDVLGHIKEKNDPITTIPSPGKRDSLRGWTKHDAILHHWRRRVDLLVVDFTSYGDTYDQQKDISKLVVALSANLEQMIPRANKSAKPHLRSFGMLISGYTVHFLEARLECDAIVVYRVGQCCYPKTEFSSGMLAHVIEMFVAFKRRIEATADLLYARPQ